MSEPAQKWENYAIFKQNYTIELFYCFKWPILVVSVMGKI